MDHRKTVNHRKTTDPREAMNHGDGELQEDSESQEDSEPQKDDESQKGNGPQEDDNPLEDDSKGIEGTLREIYTFSEELGNALLTSRVAVRECGTASTFMVKLDIDQRWEWHDAFLESLIHDTM